MEAFYVLGFLRRKMFFFKGKNIFGFQKSTQMDAGAQILNFQMIFYMNIYLATKIHS